MGPAYLKSTQHNHVPPSLTFPGAGPFRTHEDTHVPERRVTSMFSRPRDSPTRDNGRLMGRVQDSQAAVIRIAPTGGSSTAGRDTPHNTVLRVTARQHLPLMQGTDGGQSPITASSGGDGASANIMSAAAQPAP